jgi:hypothetical protein
MKLWEWKQLILAPYIQKVSNKSVITSSLILVMNRVIRLLLFADKRPLSFLLGHPQLDHLTADEVTTVARINVVTEAIPITLEYLFAHPRFIQ